MSASIRPRRSVLYMPGSNARALARARNLPADGLILDLEDAVAPDAKEQAREQVLGALRDGGYGRRETIVRVNALGTPWGPDDLAAVARSNADACLLPKIETADQVHDSVGLLDAAGADPDLPVWIMAETPSAVLHLDAIAAASPRLTVIVIGAMDLAKSLRADPHGLREGLLGSLSHCVLAARAHALDILDGVHTALDDAAGFVAVCEQGRRLGFDGKTLIHPRQIAAANEVFGVTDTEAARAEVILSAWKQAEQNNQAVTVVEGRLVERLHVDEARRILALRSAISDLSGEQRA